MKCIHCYREIKDTVKFCTYCGTKQPEDREAYEREHPELAEAIPEEEVMEMIDSYVPPEPEPEPVQEPQQPAEAATSDYGTYEVEELPPTLGVPSVSNIPYQDNSVPTPAPAPSNTAVATLVQCPDCGRMVASDAYVCPFCGCPFVSQESQNVPVIMPQAAPPAPPAAPIYPTEAPQQSSGGTNKVLIGLLAALIVGILALLGYYLYQKNSATYLTADTTDLYFSRKGGDKTVNISTDGNSIEVADCPSWLNVTAGNGYVTVNCDSGSDSDRSGVIMLKSGSINCGIKVTQRAHATFISLSEQTITQGREEGDFNIKIQSDGGGFSSTAPDYCTVSNLTDEGFTLHIDYNSGSHRDGVVTITDGSKVATLSVSQKGRCTNCGGDGKVTCGSCGGLGEVYNWDWDYYDYCSSCGGDGIKTCSKCGGTGIR